MKNYQKINNISGIIKSTLSIIFFYFKYKVKRNIYKLNEKNII